MKQADASLHRRLTEILRAGGVEDAELEAGWIIEDAETPAQAEAIAGRRAKHEPLQYLLGQWEFYGLPMKVGAGVLIPRADTETLVEAVLQEITAQKSPRIADLCTGSGCIALALASQRPDAAVTGLEISPAALEFAKENQRRNALRNAEMLAADVLDEKTAAQFSALDVIVSNPPYLTAEDMRNLQTEVRHEPALALDGGTDGLHFYREITRLWKNALHPGGLLAFEIGCTQAADVTAIFRANGFAGIRTVKDLGGNDRAVLGRLPDVHILNN